MKQVNLTITFDEEKLSALKRYMGKKEMEENSGFAFEPNCSTKCNVVEPREFGRKNV